MTDVILTATGILLPSVLLTVAVRRWIHPIPRRVAAGLLLLAFAFLNRAVFTPDLPVPLEEVMRGYPYRGVVGEVRAKNPLTNDTVKLFLPWMQIVREEIFSGRAPLWNRYSFSGYPLLGNGETAPFSPFFLTTLFVPLPKQLVAMAGLKLYVALLFTYLLLRVHFGVSQWPAAFAAVLFTFSVYQTVYLYYSATAVSLLLPAAVFAFLTLAKQSSFRTFLFAALTVAALLAAGHPESVLHVAIATVVLLLIDRASPRAFVVAGVAALAGLLLSAMTWVPVLEQILHSARLAEIQTDREMTPSLPFEIAGTLLYPDAFGNPARGTWHGPLNYSLVASSYVGFLPLLLLPIALFSRRSTARERLIAAAAIVTFLVAMNWTIIGRIVNAVPPFSLVANDKIRLVTVFLVAVAAAMSLERLASRRRWVAAAALVFTVGELFVWNIPFNAMSRRQYFVPQLPIIDRLHDLAPDEPFRILGVDWVLLPNASAQYGLEDIRGSDPMAPADYVRFFRTIEIPNDPIDVKRVNDLDQPGVDYLNVRYVLSEPDQDPGPSWTLRYRGPDGKLYENSEFLPRFFTPANLIERSAEPLQQQLHRIRDFREAVLVDGGGGPNTQVETMWIRRMNPGRFRITLDAPRPLFIASSQPATPGWRVRVNDRPVEIRRVNGAFIGFFVPKGKARIVVEYRPMSFYGSVAASLVATAGLLWIRRRFMYC